MGLQSSGVRCFVFVLAVLQTALLSGGQTGPLQAGSMDGQVTNSLTGEGVGGAAVHLIPLRYKGGDHLQQLQATAQADGSFHFESVSPGNYAITAERAGFVRNELNSRSRLVAVLSGQALSGVAVSLTPEGSISGKIEEEDGTPVPGARVEALAPLSTRGRTALKLYSTGNTDAQGRFSLGGLPPNEYYVLAEPPTPDKKKPKKDGDLVRTFFPRSFDIDGGSTIGVSAGQSVSDIAVRVRRTTTFHIRGKIADSPGETGAQKLTVAVSPRGAVDSLSLTRKFLVDPNKTFDVGGLTTGAYTLRLTAGGSSSGRHDKLLARQDVEIGAANLDGIVLSVMPGLTVSGQIRVEGPENAPVPRVSVVARPLEDMSHATQGFAKVARDGSFTFSSLDPGLYVFHVFPADSGMYVKSITLNQQDVLNKEADLSEMASARLEVVMSPGAAEVDGTVKGTGDAPVSTVVLVPETVGPDGTGVLFSYSRPDGSFAVKNVRPGKYFGYAVQRGDPNIWQNPEFLQSMQAQGTSVTVAENSRVQIQLPQLSLEQVKQAAGRLGLQAY
jgi:Carboxypeptidase regulatory-like domain